MDIRLGAHHDILSPIGFCNALAQLLAIKPGGGFFAAPVCSSWVFMMLGHGSQKTLFCLVMSSCLGPERFQQFLVFVLGVFTWLDI